MRPPDGRASAVPVSASSAAGPAAPCPPGTKAVSGTITGEDGRALNVLVGIDAVDSSGQKLAMDGSRAPALPYTTVLRLNPTLPPEGRPPMPSDATTFSACLPSSTHHGNIELYPKNQRGTTTQTRYGNAMRPLPAPGPWPGLALKLPLVCAVHPQGTGRVSGTVKAAGVLAQPTRGPAWALGPNPQGIWGFAAGSRFTVGSYTTQELASGTNYDVRITYNAMTTRRTGIAVHACATTRLDLDCIGDASPSRARCSPGTAAPSWSSARLPAPSCTAARTRRRAAAGGTGSAWEARSSGTRLPPR